MNALRSGQKQAEVAVQFLLYGLGAFVVLVVGGAVGFGTAMAIANAKYFVLDLILWAILLFWQLMPALIEGYSPGLSFRELARYPVSFHLYFALNAAYGLFDPAALASLLWLFSMWLGILAARPEWALPAAGLFLLFAAFNLLCNRILMAALERFQSTRRGRERMVVIFLALMFLPQLINFAAQGWIKIHLQPPAWLHDAAVRLRYISPPSLVARAMLPGGTLRLLALLLLLGYVLLLAALQLRQLRAAYQGEIYSDRFVPARALKIKLGWRFPGTDDKTSAIVEKEFRYLRQNSRLMILLFYPVILLGFMMLGGPGKRVFSLARGGNLLAALAGFLVLSVSNLSYNIFGMDREGFGRWMLCPMSLQRVMRAKHVAQGAVMVAIYLLGALALMMIGHVPVLMLVAVTAGFLSLLIVQLGAGSLLSVYWPKRIELTQMNSRMTSGASGFASLLITLPMAVATGIVVFATWYWNLAWLPVVAGLAALGFSLKFYSYLIDRAANYAHDHLEQIASQLGV